MTCLTQAEWASRSPLSAVWSAIGVCVEDTTEPTITSDNPSGSYAENVAISGVLTANETVTWSVEGTDAAYITVSSTTGVWSITSTPDYETKSSYTWRFVATDSAGNIGDQVVSITITDVVEAVPAVGEPIGLLLVLTRAT